MELESYFECFMYENIVKMKGTAELLSMSFDNLLKMIDSDKLVADSEECVYEAVIDWINCSKDDRKKYIPKLFKAIRFDQMDVAVKSSRKKPQTVYNMLTFDFYLFSFYSPNRKKNSLRLD